MTPRERAVELALELGFDRVGFAPLAPPPRAAEFEDWLDGGHHAGMDWLERQRERIVDPGRILPGARTLLVVGLGHARPPVELAGGGRVARYAAGRDYHNWIGKRLKRLARQLEEAGLKGPTRGIVDAGPLLERSHAAVAGLGSESKAANLLAPGLGPWIFLGELLLGEELEPGPAAPPAGPLPSCGTCTACLDACPTDAFVGPGRVDARRCISYLTIEHAGPVPRELRAGIGEWAFGCDVCSEVCPWGREAPDSSSRLGDHDALAAEPGGPGVLVRWLTRPGEFPERFRGSPLQRPRREGLARNAAHVLGNRPGEEGREALLRALEEDPSPVVRAAAGWALARGHGEDAGVRAALDRAHARERDPGAREDLRLSLEGDLPARSAE